MYETADFSGSIAPLPPEAVAAFCELAARVEARSQIVWGEHCTECAFPHCYASCDFYTPRLDGHCRRFEGGVGRAWSGGTLLGRVRFKKWGKLEGEGPVRRLSAPLARRRETLDHLVSPAINLLATAPRVYRPATRKFNLLKMLASKGPSGSPSCFVAEIWCDDGAPPPLLLNILPRTGTSAGFRARLDFDRGYNRRFIPIAEIAAQVDLNSDFLIQLSMSGDNEDYEYVFGLIDFVWLKGEAATLASSEGPTKIKPKQPKIKCVVWDLDNTVWRGTLAEDGAEALVVAPEIRAAIEELDRRGILQSVASKNDPEPALQVLTKFGLSDFFLFPQINWGAKSVSLRRIADSLDISLDTFAFVDDQAFERGEVGEALPEVMTATEAEASNLLTQPRFAMPATAESGGRRQMYRTEERRQSTYRDSGVDYLSFLRNSGIELQIANLSELSAERAYELSQRTNQLNVSGARYSRTDIAALLAPDSPEQGVTFSCHDKFGDYGIVGLCVFDKGSGRVRAFMMSCRVQRRMVENAFFAWLVAQLRARGTGPALEIDFKRTARNEASLRMLGDLGFALSPPDAQEGVFIRDLDLTFANSDIVRVVAS
jgi:FkbH-like protein